MPGQSTRIRLLPPLYLCSHYLIKPLFKMLNLLTSRSSYANSVLQALYFSEPFRELVINSPDRSYLYPPQPLLVTNPVLPTQPPVPTSAKATTKADAKSGASGHKRLISSSHGDSSSKADAEDASAVNTGPTISAQSPTLFSALRSLFIHISQHTFDKGTVAPQAFIAKLRRENELFRTTMHQDAHEFLNYLVNSIVENIEEEEKLLKDREKSIGEKEKTAALAAPPATDDCQPDFSQRETYTG